MNYKYILKYKDNVHNKKLFQIEFNLWEQHYNFFRHIYMLTLNKNIYKYNKKINIFY